MLADTVTVSGVQMKFSLTGTFPFLQDICSLSPVFPCTVRESIDSIQNCAFDRMQING